VIHFCSQLPLARRNGYVHLVRHKPQSFSPSKKLVLLACNAPTLTTIHVSVGNHTIQLATLRLFRRNTLLPVSGQMQAVCLAMHSIITQKVTIPVGHGPHCGLAPLLKELRKRQYGNTRIRRALCICLR